MRQEDFVSTKLLEEATFERLKNSDGESINWLKICWMRFVRNESYKILYKTLMNIVLTPLYKNIRQITTAKFVDTIDLLPYIPPEHHDYFKSLTHAQNVDE